MIFKIHVEEGYSKKAKAHLKKSQEGAFALPDIKPYHKAIIIRKWDKRTGMIN